MYLNKNLFLENRESGTLCGTALKIREDKNTPAPWTPLFAAPILHNHPWHSQDNGLPAISTAYAVNLPWTIWRCHHGCNEIHRPLVPLAQWPSPLLTSSSTLLWPIQIEASSFLAAIAIALYATIHAAYSYTSNQPMRSKTITGCNWRKYTQCPLGKFGGGACPTSSEGTHQYIKSTQQSNGLS